MGAHGMLKGRVLGADGPIANARVQVQTQADARLQTLFPDLLPPPRSWTIRTDARGSFALRLPLNSLYRAFATDANERQVSLVRHDLRSDSRIRLLMLRGSRPLVPRRPAGQMAYQILGRHRESQREFTIARGIMDSGSALPLLPPGPYRIRLRTRSGRAAQVAFVLHPARDLTLRPRFHEPARLLLEGVESKALRDYQVRLPEALRFGIDDEPLSEGGFSLPVFDLLLRVEVGRRIWESRHLGRIQPGNSYLAAPPLGPGRKLTFQTGSIAEGAHLLLLWREGTRIAKRLVTPGPDDKFPVLGKLPHKNILLLFHDGRGNRSVQSAPAGRKETIRLRTEEGTLLKIQVRGEGPREEFHPKLTLLARELTGHTAYTDLYPPSVYYADRRGHIRIPALPPGRWELLVEARRHVSQSLEIQTTSTEQRLVHPVQLALGFRIHGQVTGPSGVPVADVLVKLSHPLQNKGLGPLETLSDSQGQFVFEGLPEARYMLEARAEIQGHTWSARRVLIKPGAEARDLVLADEDPLPPGKRR